MTRRTVVHREAVGPFQIVETDDGVVHLRGSLLNAGGFRPRRPNARLSIGHLRGLVRAIDAERDHAALGAIEREIVERHAGDHAARELLEYLRRREASLRVPPAGRPAA